MNRRWQAPPLHGIPPVPKIVYTALRRLHPVPEMLEEMCVERARNSEVVDAAGCSHDQLP